MKLLIASILLPIVALAARGQDSRPPGRPTTAGREWSALAGSMGAMHAAMASVEPSGNGDVDFVSLMLPHHRAALDMARAELLYGEDAQMRRLAQEIVADQQSEIELMQLWLKRHERRAQQDPPAIPSAK
jgi:uncharacterized protein (DUF305 family)